MVQGKANVGIQCNQCLDYTWVAVGISCSLSSGGACTPDLKHSNPIPHLLLMLIAKMEEAD